MHIAILGAGKVGQTLGARFREVGHDVRYAVRNPADPKYAVLGAAARPVADAVRDAELVLLATPWSAAEAAIVGAGSLAGKILVDATNPIGAGGVLTHGRDDSGAEQVARWAPGARVVKAFNTIGREVMANATFQGRPAVLWLCGDDAAATRVVADLAAAIGFGRWYSVHWRGQGCWSRRRCSGSGRPAWWGPASSRGESCAGAEVRLPIRRFGLAKTTARDLSIWQGNIVVTRYWTYSYGGAAVWCPHLTGMRFASSLRCC
ncbi:NAD(P)-binding domain-containing protein [Pseudogemmatithrix spongiicola]|uniref:NAD(P)-binding domain-containing protein n=1 Tax=Pseudogemmatithrix spongiicola TaxID=3062599 RepID=A0AA49JU68_9BACT|nr:NAD(P)-binding domain-containing protein [Gemmatimonadaceae bacterium 'strain 138']WKW15000.1 NAD(P)-binding domain-containing protein [Gemmatimonadaceae bacterium 'strain 318']